MSDHKYGSGDLLSIDLWCSECNLKSWDTLPKVEATYETRWDCPSCYEVASVRRIPSAPMVSKASYPDGYKRKGFQELKEASRLQAEIAGLRPAERAKAQGEIDRLEQRTPKR